MVKKSKPVSRVLSSLIIYLAPSSPAGSSDLPVTLTRAGSPASRHAGKRNLFGLTTHKVYPNARLTPA